MNDINSLSHSKWRCKYHIVFAMVFSITLRCVNFTTADLVISFSLVNMFDSIGTLLGAAKQSDLVDEDGNIVRMKEALMSDAISTAAGALCGTSTVTTVVEGSAGIAAGGRTGMTSLTTAVMFLVAIVFAPVVGMIPSVATAPALIYVGVLMLSNIKDVDFEDITNAFLRFAPLCLCRLPIPSPMVLRLA